MKKLTHRIHPSPSLPLGEGARGWGGFVSLPSLWGGSKRVGWFMLLLVITPLATFAQSFLRAQFLVNPATATPLGRVILILLDLLSLATFIVGALALIWFFWGIIQYVLKADNEEKQTQARGYMIYAVIGMFVMFSIWGLVALVRNTFFNPFDPFVRLQPTDIPKVPVLQ